MIDLTKPAFDSEAFLTSSGLGRKIVKLGEAQKFFSQGESADTVFYLQSGNAKLTVVAANGKEATITLLSAGDFVGEESLASVGALHMATATATTDCTALKIERGEMLRVMHKEHPLAAVFIQFLLSRGMRIQSDLVDQLFNSHEKRLARTLLLMAEIAETGEVEKLIPEVSEEALAEIIGSTTPMVSFFLNRFRDLGLIDYNHRIRVHRALLNVILHDQFPDDNAVKPPIIDVLKKRPALPEVLLN
ncbi:Crp/Fnr family transcriptional regulator [Telmatobacter bradus]|uniref:Crp/Fnr family transcriptional regulator n=1 Tax=Telmatobacter bradus TaxID=474953 RepID=UPI003B43B2E5